MTPKTDPPGSIWPQDFLCILVNYRRPRDAKNALQKSYAFLSIAVVLVTPKRPLKISYVYLSIAIVLVTPKGHPPGSIWPQDFLCILVNYRRPRDAKNALQKPYAFLSIAVVLVTPKMQFFHP